MSVSVNLSSQNLHEPNFETRVKSLLAKHKVPPNFLMLELTETAVMLDPDHAEELLGKLSADGIRISIDDFGTGYSSLSYIKRLPINEVKIDKSFVMDMVNDKDDSIIVNTTLHMSHNLGLKVVAEGVENEDTLSALRALGCDIAQGYYLTRPLSASDLFAWLKSCPYSVGDSNIVRKDLIPDSFSDNS
jgi:EAL domain-containing protein (putative c-di-GMP-specific phosphodiesterase class I)